MRMLSKIRFGKYNAADQQYWDSVAQKIDKFYTANPFFAYKKRELLRLVQIWGKNYLDKRILKTDLYEEALGFDDILFDLARKNQDIYGIDISSRIVDMARERAGDLKVKLNLLLQDVRKLDFEDNFFDLIISNSTLDHFPEINQALLELRRVLKKGGVLILTLHNKSNPILNLLTKIMKSLNMYQVYTEGTYSLKETKRLAEKAGFRIIDTATLIHIPPLFPTLINAFYKSKYKFFKLLSDGLVKCFGYLGQRKTFINRFSAYLVAVKAVKA